MDELEARLAEATKWGRKDLAEFIRQQMRHVEQVAKDRIKREARTKRKAAGRAE